MNISKNIKKNNFFDIINEKKVLLLGPAPHILKIQDSLDLTAYDVVVKINRMIDRSLFTNTSLNARNDVLYCCLDVNIPNGDDQYSVEEWSKKKLKHLRVTHPPIRESYINNLNRFVEINKNFNVDYSIVNQNTFETLKIECQTSPHSGTIAIIDIMENKPSTLDIKGITFTITGYCKNYKKDIFYENFNKTKRAHDPMKQLEFFKKFYKSNRDKIIIDDELKYIINNN